MWFHKTIATTFGLGMAPFAPGTFGALGAVLFLYLFIVADVTLTTPLLLGITVFVTLLGTYSTHKVIPFWGDDPSRVVIDEFAGILVTMFFIPLTVKHLLFAFVLFRFFDILKPLGIRQVDTKIKGAWGVMLDDILAGVYSCMVLQLLIYFIDKYGL